MFSQLPTKQLQSLQETMQVKYYQKDNVVFYEGETSEYLHVLLDGIVRLYMTNPKGTQVHLHNFVAPNVFAIHATFEQIPFPATCEFLTEGIVGFIPFSKIEACLIDPVFAMSLISALSKRMQLVADLLHKETIFSAEAKIADLILHNQNIFEHVKKNKIAYLLNITPETLSRVLTKLKKEQVISIDECVITIHNQAHLDKIIETNSF
jgi:CRP/FNR family transcriptional regulator